MPRRISGRRPTWSDRCPPRYPAAKLATAATRNAVPSCLVVAPSSSTAQIPTNDVAGRERSRGHERDRDHGPERAIDAVAPDEAEEPGEEPHAPRLPAARDPGSLDSTTSKASCEVAERRLELGGGPVEARLDLRSTIRRRFRAARQARSPLRRGQRAGGTTGRRAGYRPARRTRGRRSGWRGTARCSASSRTRGRAAVGVTASRRRPSRRRRSRRPRSRSPRPRGRRSGRT